jgi:phosphatidylglycerol---prolipoprotein diacylglyceryl transferase
LLHCGLVVTWLGVAIFGGGLAGAGWLARALPRFGIEPAYAWRIFPWALLGGCLGAKLWAAVETLFTPGVGSFREVLLSRSGATFYGGLALGAAAVVLRVWLDGKSLWAFSQAIAPSLALGQAIGRVGCFLVGDDYGRPTELPWGMAFPHGLPPTSERVHPAQLYEAGWLLGCALLLRWRMPRARLGIADYLVLQGSGRFAIEWVRTNPPTVGPLTTSQVIALACVAAGTVGLALARAVDPSDSKLQLERR